MKKAGALRAKFAGRSALGLLAGLSLLPGLSQGAEGIANTENGWYKGDFHFHTNYSDDAQEQGGDWMGPAIEVAEYWEDESLVQSFPELEGMGLDFLVITDHRDIQGCSDPDMQSDRLTLICGEEFGSQGHAGAWGLTEKVSHEPTDGRTPNEQIQFAIDQVNAMGGAFSPNHPIDNGDMWFWDVDGYEAIEVWNSYWTFIHPPGSEEKLDEEVGSQGIENPYIRHAIRINDGFNRQGIAFWEAHLTVGRNLAVVGGSDRHMMVMPGQPTTFIHAESASQEDLLDGVRNSQTVVTRGPAAPQVLFHLTDRDNNQIDLGETGDLNNGPFTMHATVTRAAGGKVQFVSGDVNPALDTLGAMDDLKISYVIEEVEVQEDEQTISMPFDPSRPSWIYVRVLDLLNIEELPDEEQDLAESLLNDMKWYGEDYVRLALHLAPLLDIPALLAPRMCDPDEWDVDRSVCVEIDDIFLGTIHIAEPFHRVLNVWQENGRNTDYAMGAITSAIMVQ